MATIVVVEDQPDSRKLLTTLLTLKGHQVLAFGSGEGLVEAVRTHQPKPDLILLDIQLPGRDGYALLGDLSTIEGGRPCRVVALTAHAMAGDRERALAAGFQLHAAKPIDPFELAVTVERLASPHQDDGAQNRAAS